MKIIDQLWINIKKLKNRTNKALFLIIPVGILMALSIVVSSQVKNIQTAVDESVFGTIEEQNTLIELEIAEDTSMQGQMKQMFQGGSSLEEENYSEADVELISSMDGVESVNLLSSVPVTNVVAENLFDEKSFDIQNIVGIDNVTASLYTDQDFQYIEGEPIPIVLNANTFISEYEDWGGEETISVDVGSAMVDPSSAKTRFSPIKTQAIDYNKDDLIGKMFTLSVGGLEDLTTYTVERNDGSPVLTKYTEDEMAQ